MTTLVFAPHADDETLGMGATIAQKSANGENVIVCVLTGHGEAEDGPHPIWKPEAWDKVRSECRTACDILGVDQLIFRNLPAACLDTAPVWRVNDTVDQVLKEIQPEEVYYPFAYDLSKDHAAIAYAVSVTCRSYLPSAKHICRILAYETLSETHLTPPYMAPPFQPNVFVNVTSTLEVKLDAMRAYASQLQPDHLPRSIANLRALATLHGGRIGVLAAEAFLLVGEYRR